jgi:hypothetical protein
MMGNYARHGVASRNQNGLSFGSYAGIGLICPAEATAFSAGGDDLEVGVVLLVGRGASGRMGVTVAGGGAADDGSGTGTGFGLFVLPFGRPRAGLIWGSGRVRFFRNPGTMALATGS